MRTSSKIVSLALSACAGLASAQVSTVPFVSGLDRPVYMVPAPGSPEQMFVIEQEGAIRVIDNGVLLPTPFLDIDPIVVGGTNGGNEQGMLGLAFNPDYETSGRFFVYYIGAGSDTYVVEYTRSVGDPNIADAGSARIILTIDQPFSNHNGGWMDFGPDGFLYIATGDGGAANDPGNRASNLQLLLGKMLRIDVSDDQVTYTVPPSNPFVGVSGLDEIWSYGLRNPWRSSFDVMTGDLWIADVGQGSREEVNFQPASSTGGEHYGWRCREGFIENPAFNGCTPTPPTGFTEPVHDYSLAGAPCAVTGGYFYRGCEVPEFEGKYIFGDYCAGDVWTLDPSNGYAVALVADQGFGLSSFGQDAAGELYVMDLFGGTIEKFVSASAVDDNNNGIPDACEVCLPDVNGDGMLTPTDFTAWINAFNNNLPECDQNGDGTCTPTDFTAWIANFNAGC